MLRSATAVCAALTILVGASACANQPAAVNDRTALAQVSVSVGTLQVTVSPAGRAINGTVPVHITNGGQASVFFDPCSTVLERAVDGAWRLVYFNFCALITQAPIEVPSGEQRTFDFPLYATLDSGGGERWTAPIDGEYRMHVTTLRTARELLPEATRVSSSFRLQAQ